jgi:hypothetical protein
MDALDTLVSSRKKAEPVPVSFAADVISALVNIGAPKQAAVNAVTSAINAGMDGESFDKLFFEAQRRAC